MNRRFLFTLVSSIVALGLLLAACGGATPVAPTAAPTAQPSIQQVDVAEQNLAVVRRFYEEFSNGNADVILEVHSPTILMHYAVRQKKCRPRCCVMTLPRLKQPTPTCAPRSKICSPRVTSWLQN